MIGQFLARFGVETWAIRPADRLERQCEHHRIPYDGFKIHVIVLNHEVESFVDRIREKLLNFDLDREPHGVEAADAFPVGHGLDLGGDEHALVQALEPHIDAHRGALLDDRDAVAELLRGVELEHPLDQLTGSVNHAVRGHGERGGTEGGHDLEFYAEGPVRMPDAAEQAPNSDDTAGASTVRGRLSIPVGVSTDQVS